MTISYPTISRSLRTFSDGRWRQHRTEWPGGARAAVVIAIDFDGPSHDLTQGFPPLGSHSTGRYSGRRGVPRHLDMLSRLGIPATFFVPGYDAECYPQVIRNIAAAGHEIGAHGYLHERTLFEPQEEERRLRLTHEILGNMTGSPPVGWRSPSGQKTYTTLKVLHQLGYLYDASDKDFDMPYMLDLGHGRSLVEVPNNTYSLDDHPWFHYSMTPVSEVLEVWKREFDSIYAERGFFFLSVHPRSGWGSGSPSRTAAIESLVRYMQAHEGVTFMTCAEMCNVVRACPQAFEEMRT
ncbi:polysaccharide deacetylase family protein [Ottowia thiooxydans]|uniref:polysaccharide deacetylase family protein n=1 Tax=Ottowia thiooxydans TaxID=219182 RepID=UPI001B7FC3BC|nr:polysaccharide deacetylase family protein [Ottowia thiooxydans]